jgi:hypothetical protein
VFYYYAPAAANDNNWLHRWFIEAFTAAMNAIEAGGDAPAWEVIAAPYADALQNRPALKADFARLVAAFEAASAAERADTRNALKAQNDLPSACATGLSVRADTLAAPIATAAVALGERLFTLLTALDVRQAHYSQLWAQLDVPVCPFCGQADLDHPDLPAEDLDHYLSRKIYPFAAANLHNLAPMCSRCNMDYKGAKDVLSGTGEIERHYPYDTIAPGSVELLGSQFFANGDDAPPSWRINLSPANKADEWDRIFSIRKRYRCSILDNRWVDWLAEWVNVLPAHIVPTPGTLAAHLDAWAVHWRQRGLREKAFLKAAYLALVKEVLAKGGPQGEQLLAVIGELLAMRREPAA